MAFKYILCCWALIWRGHSLASDAWAGRLSTVGVSTLPIHPVKDGAMKHWIHGPDARSIFKRDGGILNSYHQLHSQPFGEDVGKEEDRNGSTMFAQSNSALLPNAMQISTRRAAVVGMALTSLSIALLFQSEIPALAASQETPAGMGLRPASEDQPQIPFPSSANVERQQQQPILDGTREEFVVINTKQSNPTWLALHY